MCNYIRVYIYIYLYTYVSVHIDMYLHTDFCCQDRRALPQPGTCPSVASGSRAESDKTSSPEARRTRSMAGRKYLAVSVLLVGGP